MIHQFGSCTYFISSCVVNLTGLRIGWRYAAFNSEIIPSHGTGFNAVQKEGRFLVYPCVTHEYVQPLYSNDYSAVLMSAFFLSRSCMLCCAHISVSVLPVLKQSFLLVPLRWPAERRMTQLYKRSVYAPLFPPGDRPRALILNLH